MSEDSIAGTEEEGLASTACPSNGACSTSYDANKVTINQMPNEILIKIFSYLNTEDLALHTHLVCKRWAAISQDSRVWKGKVHRVDSHIPLSMHLQILELFPKLEGVHISPFVNQDDLNAISKSVVQHVKNLKILSVPGDLRQSCPVKDMLLAKRETLLDLNLIPSKEDLIHGLCRADMLNCVALCPNLQSLTLSVLVLCDKNTLEEITRYCTRLQTLDIKDCEIIEPRNGLECLLKGATGLTTLHCTWKMLTQRGEILRFIAKNCKVLEKLYVRHLPKVGIYGQVVFGDIAALNGMSNLKELILPDLALFGTILHQAIRLFKSGAMKKLVKLDLRYCEWVNDDFLDTVFKNCPNIQELSLQGCCNVTGPAFENINLLKNLQVLNLQGCLYLRDEAIFNIVKCKTIRSLDISDICPFNCHILMMCCENLKMLRELHIVVDKICDDDLKRVREDFHVPLTYLRSATN